MPENKLVQDVKTRWYSTYDLIDSVLKNYKAIAKVDEIKSDKTTTFMIKPCYAIRPPYDLQCSSKSISTENRSSS